MKNPATMKSMKSDDPRKPAAKAALLAAAKEAAGKVTLLKVSNDGKRVQGSVLVRDPATRKSFKNLGTFEAELSQ